ncbi:MAG TPA: ABC transporter transmembrane domain-containing protein [Chthonomonadaceae bacterium]|nr:ABC transporter transmembrane domain-containing protein [Chthonomonadaceae bacterium]
MALLEALPDIVEASLRELREQDDTTPSEGTAEKLLGEAVVQQRDPAASTSISNNGHDALTTLPSADSASEEAGPAETQPKTSHEELLPTNSDTAEATVPKVLAFATDLNAEGAFGPEWLVVDSGKVYVFAPNGGQKAHLLHVVPLAHIKEAKAEIQIGNGQIEVRTDVETIPLVRFSQAVVSEANSIARQINAMAKGKPPKVENLEEKKKLCPKCKRVLPEDSEVCPACVNKRATLLRLFQFLKPFKWQAAGAVAILLSMSAVDVAPPWISGRIIDTLAPHATQPGTLAAPVANPEIAMRTVIYWVVLLASLRFVSAGLQYAQRRLNAWLGARILMDIRVSLYNKFNQLSLGYYDKRSVGSVMARITNDADNLWDFLTDGIPWFVSNILTLLCIGFVLFRMDWQLTLLILTPAPFIYLLTKWFMPRARRRWHFLWQRISKMYSSLSSTLNGMRVVKAFAQEDREKGRFRSRNEGVFQASYAANSLWATYWPIIGLLMATGYYVIYLFGGHKVLFTGAITIGTLTAFLGYLGQFYGPFQNFSRVLDWSTRSLTAAERVFEVLDTEPDIQESKHATPMPEIQGAVEFDEVSFTYDKAKRVLDDFTLKVEPGEMIGLVGHSGAGKSTIINLLSRFYDVTEGSIKIDGVDIRNIKQDDFRHQFGIVLQEPFLFPGTIRDNIAYAKPDATIEDIIRAAKAANCHNFILKFADGYDTQVGERGQRLSGGERQRISIARAILHDPKVLILDEATASVDTETEKQIQEAISNLIKNRTTFAIAHRLSTLRNATRLVVMKDGKMVECGTHDELMDQDGEYAKLVKIQNEVNKLRAV